MHEFLAAVDLWLPGTLGMAVLIVASLFFSASETALFYLSHDELRGFRTGRPAERAAAALLAEPDRLLTAVLFWNLVTNLAYFATSVVVVQRLAAAGRHAAAGAYGFLAVALLILFGEVLPKSVAVVFRRRLAPLLGRPLAVLVRLVDPVAGPLKRLSLRLRRTFWPHVVREPVLDAGDLEKAVEASHVSEEVLRRERQVLHSILDLSEIRVEEVMRPRGTYAVDSAPVHLGDLHGQVPAGDCLVLHAPGTEDVVAAVSLADFAEFPARHLEHAAEEVVHVPWCADLATVLQLLRDRFCPVASVVNEYGETVGIVTYDDLLDTILLPEPSRARRVLRIEPIVETAPGRWEVVGITTLRFLANRLGLEHRPEAEDPVTVAGMLFDRLERLPVVGDAVDWRGHRFEPFEVEDRKRIRVAVTRLADGGEPHDDDTR